MRAIVHLVMLDVNVWQLAAAVCTVHGDLVRPLQRPHALQRVLLVAAPLGTTNVDQGLAPAVMPASVRAELTWVSLPSQGVLGSCGGAPSVARASPGFCLVRTTASALVLVNRRSMRA